LAEQKGMNSQVKQFGARMAQDHAKAGDELMQIAAGKGLMLPQAPSPEGKREMDKLDKLAAADFDRAYINRMVADHKKDIAEFEKEASSGQEQPRPDRQGDGPHRSRRRIRPRGPEREGQARKAGPDGVRFWLVLVQGPEHGNRSGQRQGL
jgi:hypothetical protein